MEYTQLLAEIERQNAEIKKLSREANIYRSTLDKFTKNTEAKDSLNKALSAAAARQKAYTDMLLENCPNIIILLDEEGQFVLSTDTFLKLTNTPNFDFIKDRSYKEVFFKYLSPENIEIFRTAVSDVLTTGTAVSFDAWIEFKAQVPRFYSVEMRRTVMKTGDGEGILLVMSDLTDFLHEKQKAEEANRAKSKFLAHMSHEIRTPVTTVLGLSEIQLQTPNLPPYAKDSFIRIYNASNSLLRIINDILDFSQIESGELTLLPETYETANIISDVTQRYRAEFENNHVKFTLSVDETLPLLLLGDELRIKQIIKNLLSNAFKFTESGGVELSVRCEKIKSGISVMLIISVTDTGMGMTSEQLAAINKGTGLGQGIVFRLAEMMDAEIKIESKPARGTKVTVKIPQEIVDANIIGGATADRLQRLEAVDVSDIEAAFVPEHMPYGKVLVVDDLEANLYVVNGLLSFYNLNVEVCRSGLEAIGKIKSGKKYDIIFLDHVMPAPDGMETMQVLREMGYHAPIIALTANAIVGQAEEFIQKGFDDFVTKPIQSAKLNSVLNKYVRDRHS